MDAGLGNGAPAVGAGLSDAAQDVLTMRDRMSARHAYERMGMSPAEIEARVGPYPEIYIPPAAPPPPPERASLVGGGLTAAQQSVADSFGGTADILRDKTDGALGEAAAQGFEFLERLVGPGEERTAALQQRYQGRAEAVAAGEMTDGQALRGEIADASAAAVPQMAPFLAASAAGAKAGAKAGGVLGPRGKMLGAAVGSVVGAAGYYFPQAYRESTETAEANGLDLNDPAVQGKRDQAAALKTLVGAVTPFRIIGHIKPKLANDIAARVIGPRLATTALKDAVVEGATEVGELAVDAIMLDPELQSRMQAGDWGEIADYAIERYGRDAVIAASAGAVGGGVPGAAVQMHSQRIQNERLRRDTESLATVMEPLGLSAADLSDKVKTREGAQQVQQAMNAIGAGKARHAAASKGLKHKATDDGGELPRFVFDETQRHLDQELDTLVDKHAKILGAPMRTADLKRKRLEQETGTRDRALTELKTLGLKVKAGTPVPVLEEQASRLRRAKARVTELEDRVAAIAKPERREVEQIELNRARDELHEVRVEAGMKLTGQTRTQAVKAIEVEERRERQRTGREAAIAKQMEAEFPETMAPEAQRVRAEEIIAEYETNPDADTRGLQRKIDRLQRSRRDATTPEQIDRINDEIADLEARRGLPTPAVAAARRVLQAQGKLSPEGVVSRPEPRPELAAAKDLDPQPEPEAAVSPSPRQAGLGEGEVILPSTATAQPAAAAEIRPRRKGGSPELAAALPTLAPRERVGFAETARRALEDDTAMAAFADEARRRGLITAPEAAPDLAARVNQADMLDQATADALAEEAALAAEDDPRRAGYDAGEDNPWEDLLDVVGTNPTIEEAQARLRQWTAENGREASAMFSKDGVLLGAGTNRMKNGIMPPKQGFGDPDAIFIHTHTDDTPFSLADVRLMMQHGGEVRALLPDGQVLRMKPSKKQTRRALNLFGARATKTMEPLLMDVPAQKRHRIRQEAILRRLVTEGVIQYNDPYQGFTPEEAELIDEIFDAIQEDASVGLDAEPDQRPGTGAAEPPGRRAGGERTGTPPQLESAEARNQKRQRAAANPERVKDLANRVHAAIMEGVDPKTGRRKRGGRPDHLDAAIHSGRLTPEGLEKGIAVAARQIGNKRGYMIRDMLNAMYPDLLADPANFVKAKETSKRHDKGRGNWLLETSDNIKMELGSAMSLVVATSKVGEGFFYPEMRRVQRNLDRRRFLAQMHEASSAMKEFLDFKGMVDEQLHQPLENPDDTSQIRKKRSNRMTPYQLEPMKRTARYFQANHYQIDEARLAALTPEDMISSKGLAGKGLHKGQIPQLREIEARMEAHKDGYKGLSEADRTFMTSFGFKLREQLTLAERKLERFRDSVASFYRENGKDAPIGFLYQVDDKGRIYAEGELHPQSSDAVKGVFMVDGVSLADMDTVDASASGWQVAALIARDEVLAPQINLGAGQAAQPGYEKQDLYDKTIEKIAARVRADAADPSSKHHAIARIALEKVIEPGVITRPMIKTPIIAVNYASTEKNFIEHFTKALPSSFPGRMPPALPGYLGRIGRQALSDVAPHTMRMQDWAVDTISRTVAAIESDSKKDRIISEWTVGIDATFANKKMKEQEALIRARASNGLVFETDPTDPYGVRLKKDSRGDPIIVPGKSKPDEIDERVNILLNKLDPDATARSVYSQIIQGFDASILHRTVERYKQATNGAFVTTNHDAFTAPKETSGQLASAARESMREIMERAGDVPQRIYDDAVRNLARVGKTPEEVGIVPPPPKGSYDLADVDTSTPLFRDDKTLDKDVVPDYAPLPEEGRELARGHDIYTDLLDAPELARARDVTIADYMEALPPAQSTYAAALQSAQNPGQVARSALEKLEDGFFNAFAPIRRLEMQTYGRLPEGMDSAFKAAEIAVNDSGRAESLLFYGAAAFDQHGAFGVAPGTTGLRDIFRMAAGDGPDSGQRLQHWMEYMVARRAQDLKARGIKVPLTDQDIQTALARQTPEFTQAADAWKAFNDANLDFLEQSGRISKAQKDAMQADDFYVPFYRSDQRVGGTSPDFILPDYKGAGKGGALTARDPGIMAIKGGDKTRIANLMQNMIRNSQAIVAAGMRNRAANQVFDLLEQTGLATVQPGTSKKPHHDAIAMWTQGDDKWVVPSGPEAAPYVIALAGLEPLARDGISAFMAQVGGIFRQSITLTPPFMIRNWVRGAVSTGLLTSGANLTVAGNTLTGVVQAYRNNQATQAFKAKSGMGDFRFGSPDAGFGRNDILMEFGLAPKTAGYRMRRVIDAMEQFGTATELGDRVAAYQTMIKRGMRPDEAAYQALTIMNYNRRGGNAMLRTMLPLVPFLNARLQGYSRLSEGAVGPKGAKNRRQALMQLALNGALLTAASVAIWGWNASDEERRKKYADESLHRRLNYHIIHAGDVAFYIPKAFELGHIFSSIPELMLDQAMGDVKQLGQGTVKIITDTLAFNGIPQAIKPLIELAANHDFFRQASIEGQRESSLLARDRTTNASSLAIFLGRDLGLSGLTQSLANITGAESFTLSPSRLEHVLQGYGGIFWGFSSTAFDMVAADLDLVGAQPLAAKQADNPFGEIPVVSPALRRAFGFAAKDPDLQTTRFVEEFYAAQDKITQVYRSAQDARRNGDIAYAQRLLSQVPATPVAYRLVNQAASNMSELNGQIRIIRNDKTLSRTAKRNRLVPLIRTRNEIARGAMTAIRSLEEQQDRKFASAR